MVLCFSDHVIDYLMEISQIGHIEVCNTL